MTNPDLFAYLCCGSVKLLSEHIADAGKEGFVGVEIPDVAFSIDHTELNIQRETRQVEREGSPGE